MDLSEVAGHERLNVSKSRLIRLRGDAAHSMIALPRPVVDQAPQKPASRELDMPVIPKVDRYGWTTDTSETDYSDLSYRQYQHEDMIELGREAKWRRMIDKWPTYNETKLEVLKRRIKKGIPDCMRGIAWQKILDPNPDESRVSVAELVAIGRKKCCDTIEADLDRTMPKMPMFSEQSRIDSLRNILQAYSNVDDELGYVQGMAFIASMLLAYMDETSAYWCFANIMNGPSLKLRNLYVNRFAGLHKLVSVWDVILSSKYPNVYKHLVEDMGIASVTYTMNWFLTACTRANLSPILTLRIYDRFLFYGYRALISFGLVIISKTKKLLLEGGPADCVITLQRPEDFVDMKDWRGILKKYDQVWISEKEYLSAFKKTGEDVFL